MYGHVIYKKIVESVIRDKHPIPVHASREANVGGRKLGINKYGNHPRHECPLEKLGIRSDGLLLPENDPKNDCKDDNDEKEDEEANPSFFTVGTSYKQNLA